MAFVPRSPISPAVLAHTSYYDLTDVLSLAVLSLHHAFWQALLSVIYKLSAGSVSSIASFSLTPPYFNVSTHSASASLSQPIC